MVIQEITDKSNGMKINKEGEQLVQANHKKDNSERKDDTDDATGTKNAPCFVRLFVIKRVIDVYLALKCGNNNEKETMIKELTNESQENNSNDNTQIKATVFDILIKLVNCGVGNI